MDPMDDIQRLNQNNSKTLLVLDDDPTETQTVHDIEVLTEWMVETRTSKKFGTGSIPSTGNRKLTSPPHVTDSPCSVAKTGHKKVVDARDKLGVKKVKKTATSSDKLAPEVEVVQVAKSSQLQEGEYIIPQNLWKYLQVNKIGPSTQVIKDVRKHLDAEQLEWFKEYSVGHIIDVDTTNFSFWGGVIHSLLIQQLYYPSRPDLVFNLSGTTLTFGCHEFCIVTGLPIFGSFPILGSEILEKEI